MSTETFVIVGGGLAAAEAAKTARADGFEGRIVLVAEEPHLPYGRPPLTKDYLRGETPVEKLPAIDAAGYEAIDVDLRTGTRVTEVRLGERAVALKDGSTISFDALLLATGSHAVTPTIAGSDKGGVFSLRTIDDADAIRAAAAAAAGSTAVVAGGGWIAAETAASLRQLGLDVSLVIPGHAPLERHLGPIVADAIGRVHRGHGVEIVTEARVAGIRGARRASGVRLADGRTVGGDLVVLGFGAAPRTELAVAGGLKVSDGIVVDEHLETAAVRVFAAGDVANAFHPLYGRSLRVEHWDNARRQGRAVARNVIGKAEAYARIPYFYSDQFDLGLEFLGSSDEADDFVVRTGETDDALLAFWLRRGRVVAGLHLNTWDAKKPIDALIASGAVVDPALLRNREVPLGELAKTTAAAV